MGNVCSSGQKKKNKDDSSDKSEESPSYQLTENLKDINKDIRATGDNGTNVNKKEAPLADPEPISDISTGQNTSIAANSPTNGNIPRSIITRAQQGIQSSNYSDSVSSTPQTLTAPCEIPTITSLPSNLLSLQGKPLTHRRSEKDRKIVVYILAADNQHQLEKIVLHSVYKSLKDRCAYRGFELIISDCHSNSANEKNERQVLDVRKWVESPLEAQGGHEEAANCLAEISRHSNSSYIIPVLFLGTSLGTPLLPLTIESQDFTTALTLTDPSKITLLEKWYCIDNSAQPPCYRLNTKNVTQDPGKSNNELNILLETIVDIFSKELRDSYLTTVVEQEINNTVLISQELAKRCIWVQTGSIPTKIPENTSSLAVEMTRRLNSIHVDLKTQLSEKNLIRIPPTIQVQEDQLAAIMESLISTVIDSIAEEHSAKFAIPSCTFGVDKRLLGELESVSQYSKILGHNCANFAIMDKLRTYLSGYTNAPLIIHGPPGSGKSVLAAKIMHNVHAWVPECNLILRYANLTEISSDLVSILGSIAEQLIVLTEDKPCRKNHTLEAYSNLIKTSLDTTKIQLVIAIDSLDDVDCLDSLDWLPLQLSPNIKVVITVTVTEKENCKPQSNVSCKGLWIMNELKSRNLGDENFLCLSNFSDDQWADVLNFGGGDFYAANGALQLPDVWKSAKEKLPLQAKILWWLAWLGNYDLIDTNLELCIERILDAIEAKFTWEVAAFIMSLLIASRNGIREIDIVLLLTELQIAKGSSPSQLWFQFCWLLGPMLLHTNQIVIMDKLLRIAASERYSTKIIAAHRMLYEYFKKQHLVFTDIKGKYKCFNVQKLLQLPYHAFMMEKSSPSKQSFIRSMYLTDLHWIHDKLIATGCVQVLSDIILIEKHSKVIDTQSEAFIHLKVLRNFIEQHIRELNYDGNQFYALLTSWIQTKIKQQPSLSMNDVIASWTEYLGNVKATYLERLNEFEVASEDDTTRNSGYDAIFNLGGKGYFVASISTEREEICVWDVPACRKVRTLKGGPQPTTLCAVGEFGAAVLCRREIKVIDLDEGKFKVTLKGVMNQKMPYFGLHDSKHLVCLSRNRMYVNLMNLESGDCVTTFKAGEDRFLNSLLVSGDGRILVCGDETQKPFPLLVWHLSQRKLLYDLRIPHHDFITSLSAITHEGSYVCVVAKELNEPTPNFIVVYDLQSGTLFKKWKPNYNTVSLSISQTNACVIAGLEDSRILIWDLVTGNCRCTLAGHNAPVTLLKLDPLGKVLLSSDKDGRDTSLRLWELDSGKSLAVYTPPAKIQTCEILSNGRYVILALEKHINLVSLRLRNYHPEGSESEDLSSGIYGKVENEGKMFSL